MNRWGWAVPACSCTPVGFRRVGSVLSSGYNPPTGLGVVDWLRRESLQGHIVFLTGHAADDPRVVATVGVSGAELVFKPREFDALSRMLERVVALEQVTVRLEKMLDISVGRLLQLSRKGEVGSRS